MENILKLLKEQHGDKLAINEGQIYFLFVNNAKIAVYFEEAEKAVKIDVEMLPEGKTFVYQADVSLEDLLA